MNIVNGDDTYVLGDMLGKGGFSSVYIATLNDKRYAVKIIKKSTKPSAIRAVKEEMENHPKMNHENIVKLYLKFSDELNYYLVLEYCSLGTLLELRKNREHFSNEEIKHFILQTSNGIAYIHSMMIIHGDIKLANIFLAENNQVKIGDFGFSKKIDSADTKIIQVSGTPNYMAPEIFDSKGYSFSVDIWALTVIFYILIYNIGPFQASTIKQTYKNISNIAYSFPEDVPINDRFREIISGIFIKNVNSRLTIHDIINRLSVDDIDALIVQNTNEKSNVDDNGVGSIIQDFIGDLSLSWF